MKIKGEHIVAVLLGSTIVAVAAAAAGDDPIQVAGIFVVGTALGLGLLHLVAWLARRPGLNKRSLKMSAHVGKYLTKEGISKTELLIREEARIRLFFQQVFAEKGENYTEHVKVDIHYDLTNSDVIVCLAQPITDKGMSLIRLIAETLGQEHGLIEKG